MKSSEKPQFKVGNKVVRLNHSFQLFKPGDIATVVKVDDDCNIYVTNEVIAADINGHSQKMPGCYGVMPSLLRIVTKLELALK